MPLFFFLNLFFVYCYFFGGLSPPFYAPVPSNQMQRVAGSCYSMECLPPPIRFYYEVLPPFFSFLACCLPFCSRNNCQWQLLRTCKLGCSRKTERRTAALYWPKTTRPSLWLIRWTEGYLYGTNTYTYKHKRIHY